ncbi:hypothetical protein NLJ89_g6332 [Agrocybe chaxingu]|uniref:DUF6535 domain-containing protein n=1 Tax=Agrocybe chaxingu TaxID=84603 RepID=A0A9W8MW45_9AGAR|nr:hypothetical protein NLJ89_g6332 [Agrocybe chaxingu]
MSNPQAQGSAPEHGINQEQQSQQNQDPWAKLFESAQANDIAQCKAWNDEVANLLIFAALFSAIVTAFLLEAYKTLEPDQSELAVALLVRLVIRFDNLTDLTLPSPLPDLPFTAEAPSVRIDLDKKWVLIRHLSPGLGKPIRFDDESETFPIDWKRGPIQDQIEGVLDFHDRHSSDPLMGHLAFQCLQHALPLNEIPETDDSHYNDYLLAIMKIMKHKMLLSRQKNLLLGGQYPSLFPELPKFGPNANVLGWVALLQLANDLHLPLGSLLGENRMTDSFLCLCNPANYKHFMDTEVGPGLVWLDTVDAKTPDPAFPKFVRTIGALFQGKEDQLTHGLPHQEEITKNFRKFFKDTKLRLDIVELMNLFMIIFKPMEKLTNGWHLISLGALLRCSAITFSLCQGTLLGDANNIMEMEESTLRKWLLFSDSVQGLHGSTSIIFDEAILVKKKFSDVSTALDAIPTLAVFFEQLSSRREQLKNHRQAVKRCQDETKRQIKVILEGIETRELEKIKARESASQG